MFKFKGISSRDMQVIIEEEEHFIARAAKRYETIEIEGRNGAIFNELGYSYVERPIYVQCLNINKIDQILAWLNGEGEFEYKGRKTIARFYSQLDPQRDTCIRIIDTNFIRDPFWNKATEEYQTIKESKIKNANGNPIHITDSSNMSLSYRLNGGDRQETRSGYNKLVYPYLDTTKTTAGITFTDNGDGTITANGTATGNAYFNLSKPSLLAGQYRISGIPEGGSLDTYYIKFDGYYIANSNIQWEADGESPTESYICISQGTTVNNLIFKPMIVSGTEEKPYEQYGAMPSPNYPSNVETVGSNVNLSEINELEIEQYSSNPINITGYIEISKLPVTIQFEQNNSEKYLGWIRYYDENKSLLNQVQKSNSLDIGKGFTITESYDNAKYVAYTIRGTENTNTFPLKISKIKTEQGENKTPYSPYNMGSVEIENVNKNFIKFPETDKTENRIRYIYK